MPRETKRAKKGSGNTLTYVSMGISVLALIMAVVAIAMPHTKVVTIYQNATVPTTTVQALAGYDITSNLPAPALTLSDAPIITTAGTPGNNLQDINAQLNASELYVINKAPDAYFELAGEMLLNGTLNNSVGIKTSSVPLFKVNGKPSVIYLGSTTCIYCAENKWSMALALSRFGNFTYLFHGYSALKDGDAPTLYWTPVRYNTLSTAFGSFYTSNYINFIAIEDSAPITGGFRLEDLGTLLGRANETNSLAYVDALKYIGEINTFGGTPYTIWGTYVAPGADAIAFGNSSKQITLMNMTHADMIRMLQEGKSQMALTEYAGADYYAAMICKSTNSAAAICGLPAIKKIEATLS
ncbi:Uncharacterised protein [uncultured archaeon]|nr:Uncharacterised protein [uncultured archaeon]